MNVNFLYNLTSFTIFNMEMLEKVKAVQGFLRDENQNLKGKNVLFCRIVFLLVVIIISSFLTDLRVVYAINGILLNSFIGLIIPGALGFSRIKLFRSQDSFLMKFSDLLCIATGLFALGAYFYDLAK